MLEIKRLEIEACWAIREAEKQYGLDVLLVKYAWEQGWAQDFYEYL